MRKREHQRGFTLIEVMATVAIMVVFLAISIVAVGTYRSKLKITELDNEARQIYLAAQNRAVLLHSRGALKPLLDSGIKLTSAEDGGGSELFYITNAGAVDDTALDQLLPVGTIDPTLREGQFYIVYEPASGSVTDAFYMEEALDGNFEGLYKNNVIRASADVRRKNDPMVGWYGAVAAAPGYGSDLKEPDIKPIEIKNEDTLRAEVTWIVPAELTEKKDEMHLQVTVTYGGSEVPLPVERHIISKDPEPVDGGFSYTEVYLLDSMVKDMQFKDLFSDTPGVTSFGGDFTIRAQIEYTGEGYIPHPVETEANSLFAGVAEDGTAHIEYLRHLQNLDPTFSGVESTITKAVQDKDVDKPSQATFYILPEADKDKYDPPEIHNFQPINNPDLTSYDGQGYEIRWLYSTGSVNAGLFSELNGPDKELKGIRLMNAEISGAGSVGALCANAKDVAVEDCQVYWKAETAGAANLQDLLGKANETYALSREYKIRGGTVGGLIGSASGVTITGSFASTTVSGTTVGGLVGSGVSLNIIRSYADSYLTGSSAAAGLVGNMSGNGSALTNVYSAGFISRSDTTPAAGLYLGEAASVTNSYAAMAYSSSVGVYPLSNSGSFADSDSVCYLRLGGISSDNGGTAFTSAEELSGLLSAGFKEAPEMTYAYNLRPSVALFQYPYPGLEGLDHYGDWLAASKPQGIDKLVYWEQYTEHGLGIGIWGEHVNTLQPEDSSALVETDGYALLLEEKAEVTVTYIANSVWDDRYSHDPITYTEDELLPCTIDGKTYYLAKLPAELMNASRQSFSWHDPRYLMLDVTIGTETVTYWYEPHFANVPVKGEKPDGPDAASVRSARHLYNLSAFDNMYSKRSFDQELDIDYSVYVPQDGVAFEDPMPIIDNFLGTYDGRDHHIWNVSLKTAYIDSDTKELVYCDPIGMFGASNNGTIKNVLSFGGKDKILEISGSASAMGALVGINNGTVENCTVENVRLVNTNTGTPSMGGLAGASNGPVKNCHINNLSIESSGAGSNIGGLIGTNNYSANSTDPSEPNSTSAPDDSSNSNKAIEGCTVNQVSLTSTSDSTGGTANVGGLIGQNFLSIKGCTANDVSITSKSGSCSVGGLLGNSTASIESSNVADVTLENTSTNASGTAYAGGLAGTSGPVKDCTANRVSITSTSISSTNGADDSNSAFVGGLLGQNNGYTYNCSIYDVKIKSTSTLGKTYVGGLLGQSNGSSDNSNNDISGIKNCTVSLVSLDSAANSASGIVYVGGLVGQGGLTVSNCSVENVDPFTSISTVAETYVGGLMGQSGGTIEYCTVHDVPLISTVESPDAGGIVYVGGLVGQGSSINNCAVGYVSLDSTSTVTNTYIGGMVGHLQSGPVTACSASTDWINADSGFVGGFAGFQGGTISSSYAISRIDARPYGTAAGFAVGGYYNGYNTANISNCYAAVDVAGGDPQYAFAPNPVTDCCYLNKGIYLDVEFKAPVNGGARSATWGVMTGNNPLNNDFSYLDEGDESGHRLPAIVKDVNGNVFHLGNTVTEAVASMPVGVYYWENETSDHNSHYHFSVFTYDPATKKYAERELPDGRGLCTTHGDHADDIITNYGYGWFCDTEAMPGWDIDELEGIGFGYNNGDWYKGDPEGNVSRELAGVLSALGIHEDAFHSFSTAENNGQNGLYLSGVENGKLTIKNGTNGQEAVFEINPFFANAIGYDGQPLGESSRPYEIRSVRQLQFINWNGKNCTTYVDADNGAQFPFLNRRDIVFLQTHDIDGLMNNNIFPIAAYKDSSGGGEIKDVPTAFSGSYDGQSYVIQNIRIGENYGGSYNINTIGLFGTTVDARLANIILCSMDPYNISTITIGSSGWYYAGPLVGLALQTQDGSASITNCASAGFTISDNTHNPGRYGGNIGGLVGAANVQITRCTAVNDIKLEYSHNRDPYGIRVGGLCGACENEISACYSGGNISIGETTNNTNTINDIWNNTVVSLYVGRVSGGVDMKLDIDTLSPNGNVLTISDCYSYVTLPNDLKTIVNNTGDLNESRTRELYNIAGDAELQAPDTTKKYVTVDNSYYLEQAGFGGNGYVTPTNDDCTKSRLEGIFIAGYGYEEMTQVGFLNALNAGVTDGSSKFGSVDADASTTYSPDNNDTGKPYPFPAVLTRDGTFVHYGKLPKDGTASASAAMAIDLFTDYDAAAGAAYQDNLVWPSQNLAAQIPGGVFRSDLTRVVNAEGDENVEPVCQAAFVNASEAYPAPGYGQRILRVTFLRPGDAAVTVYYGKPDADVADCVALTIPVTDTAELHMQPADTAAPDGGLDGEAAAYGLTAESVTAFTGAATELDLYPFDKNNEPIDPALKDRLSVTLTGFGYDGVSLTAAGRAGDLTPGTEDAPAVIALDGAAVTRGVQTMTVDYSYTIEGVSGDLTGSDDIQYEVKDLTAEPEPIVFVRQGGSFLPGSVTYGAEDIRFTVGGEAVAVDDLRITSAVSSTGGLTFALNSDGSVTAAPGAGSYALEQTVLDLTFTYGPASHSVTVYPLACFYEDGMALHLAGSAMIEDGSIELYAGDAAAMAALSDAPFDAEPVSVEMTDMPELAAVVSDTPDALSIAPVAPEDDTAAPAPGIGTPMHVVEYLDEDWTVQWSLEGAVASYVSLAGDNSTAWLNVTGLPQVYVTEGVLTVTVTLPEPWLGVTFTGSFPVRLINENTPASTPAPVVTPAPEYTAPPVEEITPAPPVQEPEWQPEPEPDWQPEWEPEPVPDVPDAPDAPDIFSEDEFIPW